MDEKLISETIGALLVQVCRAHRNKAQELLARIDLHPGHEFLLINLWPQDGLTHTEIAEHLCVQPATLSRMLDRLLKTGLVQRQPDSGDQRVSRVYLTEKGRDTLEPIREAWEELERISFAKLTLEERLLLRRILLQVSENLEDGHWRSFLEI